MRIPKSCAKCLYDKQENKTKDPAYLAEVRELIENRKETDCSPYMVYLFNQAHLRRFGKPADYSRIKKQFNDLVLGMENVLRDKIKNSNDPLATSIVMARIGNYIDFGAMNHVDKDEFLSLFDDTQMKPDDKTTYRSFIQECEKAKSFLLICDNCGEIVLDKLMIEQLKKRFPNLEISALVRGGDVLNDATEADAKYTGLDKMAKIISNGDPIAGTIYDMMPKEAQDALDNSDVILAKGQGNYESLSGQGRHAFYEFLCKCDHFTEIFNVPRLTGMFIEER